MLIGYKQLNAQFSITRLLNIQYLQVYQLRNSIFLFNSQLCNFVHFKIKIQKFDFALLKITTWVIQSLPNIPLPPVPVLTGESTWFKAALFYADDFDEMKHVVATFDPPASRYFNLAQELFSDSSIHRHLIMLKTLF